MGMSAKIKYLLNLKNKKITDFAKELGMSQSNFSNKLQRDDFRESELKQIADALDCDFNVTFTIRETGETI